MMQRYVFLFKANLGLGNNSVLLSVLCLLDYNQGHTVRFVVFQLVLMINNFIGKEIALWKP